MNRPEVVVGAVARRDDELLLIRRGSPPERGLWSIPSGRVEWGEDLREALVREVYEETRLEVVVTEYLGWAERIDIDADPPFHFVIHDFLVDVLDPTQLPVAATDALEAQWVPIHALGELALVEGLLEFLSDTPALDPRTE